jgi:outer membrane protein
MKKTLMVFAALVAPALAIAQEGARPISLPEAVTLAKKNAPTMISARGTIRTNASLLRVAKWAYNPLNNVQFSYGSSTGGGGSYDAEGFLRVRPASEWGFTQGFGGATLTIWDGGTKIGNIKSARANIDASEAQEVAAEFSISQQVKQQYYSILQGIETEANAREALKQSTLQLDLAKAKLAAGTATKSETLQTFVQVTNARIAILNAQNSQLNANAQLTRLTASPFTVTAIVSDTADPPPLMINDMDLFALAEQGPSVRQSAAQYKATQVRESNSKAIYWPQIQATGGYSRSNSDKRYDFGAGPMNYSWNFGLTASFRIFDGFARENSVISAKVATDNAEASLREQKFTQRQNLTQQLGSLHIAEETIKYQRLNIAAGEENLRVVTTRYQLGSGLLLDVVTAQNTLNSSRASLTSARVNARNARAQIESIIGRDLQQ